MCVGQPPLNATHAMKASRPQPSTTKITGSTAWDSAEPINAEPRRRSTAANSGLHQIIASRMRLPAPTASAAESPARRQTCSTQAAASAADAVRLNRVGLPHRAGMRKSALDNRHLYSCAWLRALYAVENHVRRTRR